MNAPALFISHGSPMTVLTEDDYAEALRAFGRGLDKPAAVVVVSAHGMSRLGSSVVTAGERPELVYDFAGFPPELYAFRYACPGSPKTAAEVARRLRDAGASADLAQSGIDHGVWVPLARLFPDADVPVVQVSMPYPSPTSAVYELGRLLAPLREEGVMLIGSGGAVHNLRELDWHGRGKGRPPQWAKAFNDWVEDAVARRDAEALLDFERRAPQAQLAHPTPEHFYPLLFTLGASTARDKLVPIADGFQYETLSMYSFAYA